MDENLSAVKVPVAYYSQVADECVNLYDNSIAARLALKSRQFEWTSCGDYHDVIETGLIEGELNEEYLPVAVGGSLTANRGVKGENFQRWFRAVQGVSESRVDNFILSFEDGAYVFDDENFQPVEGLFTMSFGLPFMATLSGEEEFEITADDDTFVFLGNRLVIDMGGIHSATTGRFVIKENAEVYAGVGDESLAYTGVNLKESGVIRVFHANRDSRSSVFKMRISGMTLNTKEDTEGVLVQYDPMNPGYMAPLGTNLVVEMNQAKVLAIANTIKGMSFGLIGICAVAIICVAWKCWRRGRNREE